MQSAVEDKQLNMKIGMYIAMSLVILSIVVYVSMYSAKALTSVLMLLLPIILTIIFDRSRGKYYTIVIGLCNLSGILLCGPKVLAIAAMNSDVNTVIDQIINTNVLLIVYVLSAVGFLIAWVVPELYAVMYTFKLRMRNATLKNKLQKIGEKWTI